MGSDNHLLTDLALDLGDHRLRPVYRVSDEERRLPAGRGGVRDLRLIGGRDNLRQAIMMRLLTPVGELAGLGHPDYGSRLFELVGRVNTDTTRNLARLYILESLQLEPRISKVNRISVTQVDRQPNLVAVELEVTANAATDVINIGPFTLSLL
jgi:phage baseplate assembly protein W